MKHQALNDVRTVAEVEAVQPMSPRERLQRWADLLERDPDRTLATLRETEFCGARSRDAMRADDSPISVAFADPVLRAHGLAGDTYGDAKRFFGLSDWRMHDIVCSCHYGGTMSARMAAQAVRHAVAVESRPGLLARLAGVLRITGWQPLSRA